MYDYLIVGCGFAGAVMAERLASVNRKKVLIIDQRNHVGGNAYDFYNEHGILVHKYGPHIFHTQSKEVFEYLSRFTPWRPYEHRVLASVEGQLVPVPINLNTINALYGLQLSSAELKDFLKARSAQISPVRTSEDVVLNAVGQDLYEKFFRGYTRKQWGLDPSELDASVAARIPTRHNGDNRYFTDTYQAMPLHGYTHMFEQILRHPNIHIMLNTNFEEVRDHIPYRTLIYTGPIDVFFKHCYGPLPYRSLDFEFQTFDRVEYQPTGTVNFPLTHLYTRSTEFKHLTGQQHAKTTVVFEYPKAEGDPYYPIPQKENQLRYNQYKALAEELPNVFFTGRLGTYKYYNMDQVVAQSLALHKRLTVHLHAYNGAVKATSP